MIAACCPCRQQKARNAEEIKRIEWRLTQFNGRSFAAENGYTLTFGDEGRISGVGDCNRLVGTYTLDNTGILKINPLASTRMMCPNQLQEDAFMQMLQAVDSWQIDGGLLMFFKQGEMVAAFERK